MSRSNNTELIKPCKKYFEWQGSTGKIKYFDKSIGEKGQNVILDLPFTFLVLDKLATIRGFSDLDQSGFWSNEVRNIKNEKLTVRTSKGIIAEDFYSNLAPVLNMGASFCQSVYIAYYEDKELAIGNLQLHGSAIGPWFDFCKRNDVFKGAVKIAGAEAAKKGATNYFTPVFSKLEVKPETDEKAIVLDKELQEYLAAYFERGKNALPNNLTATTPAEAPYTNGHGNGHPDGRPAPARDSRGSVMDGPATELGELVADDNLDLPF